MTACELANKYGLMYCADHAAEYMIPVLRRLAKIVDNYGKVHTSDVPRGGARTVRQAPWRTQGRGRHR